MNRKSILSGPAAVTAGLALTLALGGAAPAPALAETAAAEQSQQAADTKAADTEAAGIKAADTEAADTKAADTKAFTANGQGYDSFAEAVKAAAGAKDKTVTINESTTNGLEVPDTAQGITVTAAKGVEFRGQLSIAAKNVTVKDMHFIIDDKGTNSLSVKVNNGTTVTGCTFDIRGTRNGQFNSIWAAKVTDVTFEKNTFNIAVNANKRSWVGINLVGPKIKNVTVNENTLNALPPDDASYTDGGSPFLVVANGNEKTEGSYGIDGFTVNGNTVNDKTGFDVTKSRVQTIAFQNVKDATLTNNKLDGYMGFAYTGWPNNASSTNVTIKDNTLNTFVGVYFRDTDFPSGSQLVIQGNTYGENTKHQSYGTASVVIDQNGKAYPSIAKAIEAGATTVTLLQNVTEDVTIAANQTVTLDLAGHTLTNKSGDTITNNGTLTVTDSSAKKTGAIDNVTHGKAALKNEEGATATLNGGTFKRSKETGTKDNTFYTILNHGDMTINDGTTVELLLSDGKPAGYSSLIDNGYYSGKPANGKNATMVIDGGKFDGGKYVKNDSYGEMTINGGTFTNGASNALFNCNNLTINGGTFDPADSASGIVLACKGKPGAENGQVTIAGGTFKMTGSQKVVVMPKPKDHPASDSDIKISGGTYEGAEPKAEQIVDGSGLVKNADGTFGVKKAELLFSSGVENQTVTYDVAKGGSVTKDDLLKLVTVSVEGYTVKVDTTDLDALNKAIAAKDTSKTFSFEFSATKNGETKASMTTTITYKLTDSEPTETPEAKPADKKPANKKPADKAADKAALPKTGDNQVAAAVAATVAGAAAVAGGVAFTRRRAQR